MRRQAILSVLVMSFVALAGCNSDKDTDEDGIPDAVEKAGWDILVYTMTESMVVHVTSDPEKMDTDGDGLSDWDEIVIRGSIGPRLDPSNPDTDGDGLTDCYEWHVQVGDCPRVDGFRGYDYKSYLTDPSFMDSDLGSTSRYLHYVINDGDGYQDHEGFQSTGPEGNLVYNRGDGIMDSDEIFGYDITRPDGSRSLNVRSNPAMMDTDDDGLEDGEEALIHGSEPNVADTDGDGCLDGRDLLPTKRDSYRVQLNNFTLAQNPGTGTTAQMIFITAVAARNGGDDFQFQPPTGHESVNEGETIALSYLTSPWFARSDCGPNADPSFQVASAYRPWILVQVLGADKKELAPNDNRETYDEQRLHVLDLYTNLPSPGNLDGQLFWNPQVDAYRWGIPAQPESWTMEGDSEAFTLPESGWFEFSGAHGTVTFRPQVRLL